MSKLYGAIDPGKQGIVALCDGQWFPIPVIGKGYDHNKISEFFSTIKTHCDETGDKLHFVLEDVNQDPTWGASQNWSLGSCKSLFEQVFADFKIPFTLVHPKTWQKEMHQGVKIVYLPMTAAQKRKGRKNGSVDTKTTSLIAAQRLMPEFNFYVTSLGNKSKNFNDNLVDAKLMLEYAKRKF
jgi:actin-related protein